MKKADVFFFALNLENEKPTVWNRKNEKEKNKCFVSGKILPEKQLKSAKCFWIFGSFGKVFIRLNRRKISFQ